MKDIKGIKKAGVFALALAGVVGVCAGLSMQKPADYHEKYEGCDLTQDVTGATRSGTYTGYIDSHEGAAYPDKVIDVDLFSYKSEGKGKIEVKDNFEGEGKSLFTDTESRATFNVDIPEEGFYELYMEYCIPESRGVAAERTVYIDGAIPFDKARNISFTRVWTDDGKPKVDNQGNEIRPRQKEVIEWQASTFKDDMGYSEEPYYFYFTKGNHTLSLEAANEPVAIKKLQVKPIEKLPSYEEYSKVAGNVTGDDASKNFIQKVQGEDSTFRSESSLYAKYDRSSPTTQPSSVTTTVLNYTGGESWRKAGQWIEWDFEVPSDGAYNITIKGRQNYQRGSVSNRCVYIDGKVPFKELQNVSFDYKNDWTCKTLGDDKGDPYNIYLTKGKHTIRLEAVLGDLGPILESIEDSTFRLNQIYRKILVYTGANPDKYRDYKIDINYPEVIEAMDLESKRLYKIVDDAVSYTGQKEGNIAAAQTLAKQLERFVEKPDKISVEFTTFKDNITALGTASLNMSETKLDIDYITVSGVDVKVPKDKTNFVKNLTHEIASFAASFTTDYNSVGDVYDEKTDDIVKVWVLTGRDQGTILKSMIDDDFTPNSKVKVNVEVVEAGALLNAVIAGRGPNVVLSVGADQPVNYALRNAAEDITQFDGWQDVLSHYSESSYRQYKLGDKIYAVPEQQTFNVLFYRKDVLDELGLKVPETWDDLINELPTIQGNNLSVGIPSAAGSNTSGVASTAVASNAPDLSMYFTLLYQHGGEMYNKEGTKTAVNEESAVEAFDSYLKYFNDYGFPTFYDFVSRFRSGEMPIGISPYSTYNTLVVSAPEIRGLWDFTLIPGTKKEDGTIDRTDFITGNATMMIKTDNEKVKQNSWEFMKWWANADTQVRFGREIEALLGASARYATANRDAFKQLSWSYEDIKILDEQWDHTQGIPEVPGGYYTGRHLANACRKVINEKADTREAIIDYSILINDELTKKRKEFGLPVAQR